MWVFTTDVRRTIAHKRPSLPTRRNETSIGKSTVAFFFNVWGEAVSGARWGAAGRDGSEKVVR